MPHQIRHVLISAAWLAFSCATLPARAQSQPPMTEPGPDSSDKLQADLCASKTGDAREACLREGQDRQISAGVRGDVRAQSTNSAYNVARAKCDTLSGTARDNCIAAAKSKYKQ
jgi:hypothetical protein